MIRILPGLDGRDRWNNSTVIAALAHAMTTVVRIRAMIKRAGLPLPAMIPRRSCSWEHLVDFSEVALGGWLQAGVTIDFDAKFSGSS